MAPRERRMDQRITYLMTFRTALVTLLLGVIVLVAFLVDSPLGLSSPHSQVLFGTLVLAYATTLLYAFGHRHTGRSDVLFAAVLVLDALLLSVVVHITGGIQSVWTFLYPLLVVEAAIVGYRRWALWASVGVALLFLATTLAGYGGLLPLVEGQVFLPDRIEQSDLATALLLNLAAQVAIALLAAFLADQLRRASAHVAEAEESLRDMVRLNEQILESLDGGLVTLDLEGHVLQANTAARSLLGQTLERSTYADLAGAMPDLPSSAPEDLAPQRLRSRLTPLGPGSDASPIPVEVTITRLVGEDGARIGSILHVKDLTEIRDMEERMQRAERLAAVGRVAAGIAHEIRNPLAAVSGSLELLRSGPECTDEDRRLLEIALGEVERLETLVKNLLGFARPRPPEPVRFDLATLAREVIAVFRQDPQLGEREFAPPDSETGSPVDADPDQIRQVLWNLLRNAAEATEPGGRITVSVTPAGDGPLPWVRLRVADSGPGIPAGDRPRIFEPFFSTKEKGSGLGLPTVHRIVEDHGGRVEVESPPEGGTAFVVLLPRAKAAGEGSPVGAGHGSAPTPDADPEATVDAAAQSPKPGAPTA